MSLCRWILCLMLSATPLAAQLMNDASLVGRYFFRHLVIRGTAGGQPAGVHSILGSLVFDGRGAFTFSGQRKDDSSPSVPVTGAGTYAVTPGGRVTLTNPLLPDLSLNAGLSTGMLLGSTTERSEPVFDLLVAIPAPSSGVNSASWNGTFWAGSLEISPSAITTALFPLRPDGTGRIEASEISGHATSQRDGAPFTENLLNATYGFQTDGSGDGNFPDSSFLTPRKTLFLSSDGNIVIGGSTNAGVHDLLIAIRGASLPAGNASLQGRYWTSGLRVETGILSAFSGSAAATGSSLTWSQRITQNVSPSIDFTGANRYTLGSDGSGTSLRTRLAVGSPGSAFLGAGISNEAPDVYELYAGAAMPAVSGTGVFLNPQGILNSASFAPAGSPISPGQFVTLFGAGLAPRQEIARTTTLPSTLAGVSVSIGSLPAPVYFVSPSQISILVPFAAEGPEVDIQVVNNGASSNKVRVRLAPTAPGVFTANQSGAGIGAILHADFRPVTASDMAQPGETVLVYLTGLGAITPPTPDGTPAPLSPLSRTVQTPAVYIGGRTALVSYSGLAPGFAGLYQLNVTIPFATATGTAVPLAIQTSGHFHDQVDIPIGRQ